MLHVIYSNKRKVLICNKLFVIILSLHVYRSSYKQEQNVKAEEGIIEAVLVFFAENILQMATPLCLYINF